MSDSMGSLLNNLRLLRELLEDPKGCARQAGCVMVAVPFAAAALLVAVVAIGVVAQLLDDAGLSGLAMALRDGSVAAAITIVTIAGLASYVLSRRVARTWRNRRE